MSETDSSETGGIQMYSTDQYWHVWEALKLHQVSDSTKKSYHGTWVRFNSFVIKLDKKTLTWEHRVVLYLTHLVDNGRQKGTIMSYKSAIVYSLGLINIKLTDDGCLLAALIKAAKYVNNRLYLRLPINWKLLKLINRITYQRFLEKRNQPYLALLYTMAFTLAYFGMMRISELTLGPHNLCARNVWKANDATHYLLTLTSSKTHGEKSSPQKIRIWPEDDMAPNWCPVYLLDRYIKYRPTGFARGPFLIHKDGSPLTQYQFRTELQETIRSIDLNPEYYDSHSFRGGRATDLFETGWSVDQIKEAGRWKSNTVYDYLKN